LNTCVYVLGLAVAALLCGLLVGATPTRAEPVFPETVTYQGTIESQPWMGGSHGGTILLTFTPENELLRIELRDFVYGVITKPGYHEELTTINKVMYYNSVPSSDGAFVAGIPLLEFGMAPHSALVFQGTVDPNSAEHVNGTVTISCTANTGGGCGVSAPFSATEVVETPPADTDTVVEAQTENGGTILFALNTDKRVTALALQNVSFPNCPLDYSFSVVTFVDAPNAFNVGMRVDSSLLSISGSGSPSGSWSGTINYRSSVYDECDASVRWSTAGFPTEQPSPEATTIPSPGPTPAPVALPAAGSGAHGSAKPSGAILLAFLGAVFLATGALSLRRR